MFTRMLRRERPRVPRVAVADRCGTLEACKSGCQKSWTTQSQLLHIKRNCTTCLHVHPHFASGYRPFFLPDVCFAGACFAGAAAAAAAGCAAAGALAAAGAAFFSLGVCAAGDAAAATAGDEAGGDCAALDAGLAALLAFAPALGLAALESEATVGAMIAAAAMVVCSCCVFSACGFGARTKLLK